MTSRTPLPSTFWSADSTIHSRTVSVASLLLLRARQSVDSESHSIALGEWMVDHYGDDLALIHREALRKMLLRHVTTNSVDPELSVLQDKLVALRKRRLELYTNLQELRFSQELVSLSQEIKIRNSNHPAADINSQQKVAAPSPIEHSSGCEPSQVPPLAERMHSLRKRRRIVGAHRIAGVSIIPCPDPNVIGIRLDISIEGRYAAKHFFFLDIVGTVSGDDGEVTDSGLYLRLVQHTLPSGVFLKGIIQRHFGGSMLPLHNEVLTVSDMATVRNMAGDIYDACYANAVRKQGVSFLKKHCDHTTGNYVVHDLVFADTFRHVNFEVCVKVHARFVQNSKFRRIVVKLEYGEETNPEPTSVHVTEDDEYRDSKVLIQTSIRILRSMPLWKFFDELDGET